MVPVRLHRIDLESGRRQPVARYYSGSGKSRAQDFTGRSESARASGSHQHKGWAVAVTVTVTPGPGRPARPAAQIQWQRSRDGHRDGTCH